MGHDQLLLLEVAERIAHERGRQQGLISEYEDEVAIDDLVEDVEVLPHKPIRMAYTRGYHYGVWQRNQEEEND